MRNLYAFSAILLGIILISTQMSQGQTYEIYVSEGDHFYFNVLQYSCTCTSQDFYGIEFVANYVGSASRVDVIVSSVLPSSHLVSLTVEGNPHETNMINFISDPYIIATDFDLVNQSNTDFVYIENDESVIFTYVQDEGSLGNTTMVFSLQGVLTFINSTVFFGSSSSLRFVMERDGGYNDQTLVPTTESSASSQSSSSTPSNLVSSSSSPEEGSLSAGGSFLPVNPVYGLVTLSIIACIKLAHRRQLISVS